MFGIKAKKLTKRFNSYVAVDQLDFNVDEGEIFGLLGPNGAGKTTTLRMLACIVSPTEGSAEVGGYDIILNPVDVRRSVGIVTENPSLYERLSPMENLEFFGQAYGVKDDERLKDRIRELLDFFGLWKRRNERVGVFSRGMKQKLAIARALVHNPSMLFLDEPTAGLDPEAAKAIRDLILRLSRTEKHTVLLCTHRLEDAEKLCNRVMIVRKGAKVVLGTPEEICTKIAGHPRLEVRLRDVSEEMVDRVRKIESVEDVKQHDGRLLIQAYDAEFVAPHIVKALVDLGAMIFSVNVLLPSLEEAYLKMIGEE